jgi:hypothetical protein
MIFRGGTDDLSTSIVEVKVVISLSSHFFFLGVMPERQLFVQRWDTGVPLFSGHKVYIENYAEEQAGLAILGPRPD